MKDLLTVGQLGVFARACGAADLVVVDARAGEARAARAHRRPWAQRGWRLSALARAGAADIARLGLPVALVHDERGAPPLAAALGELAADVRAFAWTPDGRLSLGGEAQAIEPAAPDAATLVVTLDREERVSPVELPCELTLDVEAGPGTTRVIGLALEGAAPGWWHVDAAGPVTLRVDLVPQRGGDRWQLAVTPGRLTALEGPASGVPERLAVVLDRTCPDEEGWSGARALGVSGRARAADPFARAGTDEDGHRELNRAVRAGLARALAEGLAGQDVLVDAWAFADVAGEGLSPLEGVDHPDAAVQALGSGAALEVRFDAATYAPGLDIWDPLDEALDQAVETLGADRTRRGAVLLVGNSPPQVLPAPGSPFAALAGAAGCATVARRWSPTWDVVLERCRADGIPVAFAFLEHPVFRADEERGHELYSRLARRVREGLEAFMPVTRGPASEDGTRRAVLAALAVLRAGARRPTGLRLVRTT